MSGKYNGLQALVKAVEVEAVAVVLEIIKFFFFWNGLRTMDILKFIYYVL